MNGHILYDFIYMKCPEYANPFSQKVVKIHRGFEEEKIGSDC